MKKSTKSIILILLAICWTPAALLAQSRYYKQTFNVKKQNYVLTATKLNGNAHQFSIEKQSTEKKADPFKIELKTDIKISGIDFDEFKPGALVSIGADKIEGEVKATLPPKTDEIQLTFSEGLSIKVEDESKLIIKEIPKLVWTVGDKENSISIKSDSKLTYKNVDGEIIISKDQPIERKPTSGNNSWTLYGRLDPTTFKNGFVEAFCNVAQNISDCSNDATVNEAAEKQFYNIVVASFTPDSKEPIAGHIWIAKHVMAYRIENDRFDPKKVSSGERSVTSRPQVRQEAFKDAGEVQISSILPPPSSSPSEGLF